MLNAYNEIYAYLSKESLEKYLQNDCYETNLKSVRDQVLKYLKVIFITVKEEDEAYTIFETLNARGMNLSFVDLMKNKIFKELKTEHPDDTAKTKWKEIRDNLTQRENVGSLEEYVRHWWISKYKYVAKAKIYKEFLNELALGNITAEKLLENLKNDSLIYTKLSCPLEIDYRQQEEKIIINSLKALKTFGLVQYKPFLLSLFRLRKAKLIKLQNLIEVLQFLEKFHFIFNGVCSLGTNTIERPYARHAKEFSFCTSSNEVNKALNNFKKDFKDKLPDLKIFEESFKQIRYINNYTKNKKLIQYIFQYVENFKHPTNEFVPNNITIEHILPQSTSRSKYIGTLGNLLPLGKQLNGDADNDELLKKIKIYHESQYKLTQEFATKFATTKKSKWTKKDIDNRTIELAHYCYNEVWKI